MFGSSAKVTFFAILASETIEKLSELTTLQDKITTLLIKLRFQGYRCGLWETKMKMKNSDITVLFFMDTIVNRICFSINKDYLKSREQSIQKRSLLLETKL